MSSSASCRTPASTKPPTTITRSLGPQRSYNRRCLRLGITQKPSGTIIRDDYNNLVTYLGGPSSNNSLFDDDLRMNTASKGLVVVTPDGTKKFRIRVDNVGN